MSILNVTVEAQINGWYCAPASVRVALSARGLTPSQAELATALGTTTNGTNSSNDVVRVMNAYLGAGTYEPTFIGGSDASEAQRDEFRNDLRKTIDAGYALVANVVGTVTDFEGQSHTYNGGHYVPVIGYDGPDDSVYVYDVAIGRAYWTTTAAMATWIASRGYSSVTNVAAPTPVPPTPTPLPEQAPHVLFVDVSNHDRTRKSAPLDWHAMANAGVGSVMVAKASEGNPTRSEWYDDPWFSEMQQGAVAGGYGLRGAYHVLAREEDDAALMTQINALRTRMDAMGCTFGMIDVEAFKKLSDLGRVPDQWTVIRFSDLWGTVERRKLVWYISKNMWKELGEFDLNRVGGLLTCANYPNVQGTTPEEFYGLVGGNNGVGWAPYGNRVPDFWQFGSDAVVEGASDRTDINAYRGTLAQLATALAPTPATPPTPTPDPTPEPIPNVSALVEALRQLLITKDDVAAAVRAELDKTRLGS